MGYGERWGKWEEGREELGLVCKIKKFALKNKITKYKK